MHISKLHKHVRLGEFSMKFVSASGELIEVARCICTSFHSAGQTLNIQIVDSGEVRTINRYSIVEIDSQEVHL